MEQLNMPQNYINYSYSIPYYNPCFPYFNYWNQPPLQSLYYPNNHHSSPYCQQNDVYQVIPITQSINDTEGLYQPSEQAEIVQKKKNQDVVMKNIKQFSSFKRVERHSSKFQGDQKENRNVYSNILRNFFRKLNDHSKIQKLVKSIISKNRLSLTVNGFLDHVKRLKINHGKYLRFKKLRHLFIDEGMKEHSLVFRILFQYFTSGELLAQALTSRKIGRWSVVLHLKGARQLKEKLYH